MKHDIPGRDRFLLSAVITNPPRISCGENVISLLSKSYPVETDGVRTEGWDEKAHPFYNDFTGEM